MVAFANTTRHNLLSFQFVHGILILVLSVQVLQKGKIKGLSHNLNRVSYKPVPQLKCVFMRYLNYFT